MDGRAKVHPMEMAETAVKRSRRLSAPATTKSSAVAGFGAAKTRSVGAKGWGKLRKTMIAHVQEKKKASMKEDASDAIGFSHNFLSDIDELSAAKVTPSKLTACETFSFWLSNIMSDVRCQVFTIFITIIIMIVIGGILLIATDWLAGTDGGLFDGEDAFSVNGIYDWFWYSFGYLFDPGALLELSMPWKYRPIAVLITFAGIGIFSTVLALTVDFVNKVLTEMQSGSYAVSVEGHTLILNFTEKTDTVIEQICLSMESENDSGCNLWQPWRSGCMPCRRRGTVVVLSAMPRDMQLRALNDRLSYGPEECTHRIVRLCCSGNARSNCCGPYLHRTMFGPKDERRLAYKMAKVVCREGKPTEPMALMRWGAADKASVIVICAPEGNADNADKETLRILLALNSLTDDHGRNIAPLADHIVAELRDIDNQENVHLMADAQAGEDKMFSLVSHDIMGRLMIKTARTAGLALVYNRVLGFEDDEFYMSKWNDARAASKEGTVSLTGRTFGDALRMFEHAVPIGVRTKRPISYGVERNSTTHEWCMQMTVSGERLAGWSHADRDHWLATTGGIKKKVSLADIVLRSLKAASYDDAAMMNLVLNPPDDYVFAEDDELVVIAEDDDTYEPMAKPLLKAAYNVIDAGERAVQPPEKVLICGWRRDVDDMITQLDAMVAPGSELHVVSALSAEEREDSLKDGEMPPLKNLKMVNHDDCNPSQKRLMRSALLQARPELFPDLYPHGSEERMVDQNGATGDDMDIIFLDHFDSVMVLADESEEGDPIGADSHTISTVLSMRDLQWMKRQRQKEEATELDEGGNLVCEILDRRTKNILENNARISHSSVCDYLLSNELIGKVLAMVAENSQNASIILDLLGNSGVDIQLVPTDDFFISGSAVSGFDAPVEVERQLSVTEQARLEKETKTGGKRVELQRSKTMDPRGEFEELSFWDHSERVRSRGFILIGYFFAQRTAERLNLSGERKLQLNCADKARKSKFYRGAADRLVVLTAPSPSPDTVADAQEVMADALEHEKMAQAIRGGAREAPSDGSIGADAQLKINALVNNEMHAHGKQPRVRRATILHRPSITVSTEDDGNDAPPGGEKIAVHRHSLSPKGSSRVSFAMLRDEPIAEEEEDGEAAKCGAAEGAAGAAEASGEGDESCGGVGGGGGSVSELVATLRGLDRRLGTMQQRDGAAPAQLVEIGALIASINARTATLRRAS